MPEATEMYRVRLTYKDEDGSLLNETHGPYPRPGQAKARAIQAKREEWERDHWGYAWRLPLLETRVQRALVSWEDVE